MTLGRSWTRQLLGASSAALLVPGAIGAALVALAFAGGFGRLGSLGQAFSGPSLPALASTDTKLGEGAKSALSRAMAAAAAPAGVASGRARVGSPANGLAAAGHGSGRGGPGGSGSSGRRPGSGGPSSGGSRGAGSGGSGGSGSGSAGGSGGSGGSGAGAGSPPPTPAPTVLSSVAAIGTSITGRIPGPVGTVATQTLQSVGSAVNRVLPLSARGLSAAGTKLGLHLA